MKRAASVIMIFVVAFVFMACPAMTQKQQDSLILKEFTLTLKKYNDWYALQPPAVQAKWKAEIDPKFELLNLAIDTYDQALVSGQGVPAAEDKYLAAKAQVFKLLLDAGILQVEKQP